MEELIRDYYIEQTPPLDPVGGFDTLLYANESPNNLIEKILGKDFIAQILKQSLNRYPDCESFELRKAYGTFLGAVPPENIAAGNGSDELIRVIGDVYLNAQDTIISCEPAFSVYKRSADVARGSYIGLNSDDEFLRPNKGDLIKLANRVNAKVIFICTPHNPTGYVWNRADLIDVLESTPGLLVVDEAYIEFSDAESMVDLAIKHPRLLVLRTMSKAFGMASLRVGFAVGCAANIKAMLCGVDMYNINTFSQLIGRAMLERSEEVMPYIEGVKQDSKALHKDLKAIEGLKVFDCNSNFILVESPHAKAIYEALIKIKILVRNYSNNENILRISCGTPEENEKLLTCIKEVLNGEKE